MKLCRHEVRAASGERGAEARFLSFPLQCNRLEQRVVGPAFGRLSARILGFELWACQCPHSGLRAVGVPVPALWASRCGCASARILGLAVWFGAHSAPASCLRAVGAGVLALILGVRRQLRRVVIIT